jgi:tRNA-specific 2-thiouridylase
MPKRNVRALANELGLRVAEKPDSQDICFVPSGKYQAVVEKLRPGAIEPGEIVHVDGRVMGEHGGVINFTVGQRRGLGVATGEPLFVVKLDAASKRVMVGPRDALGVRRIALKEVNWIGEQVACEDELDGREILVRVRSTRPPVRARLEVGAGWHVVLDATEEGVAPGQAAVFYAREGGRVLGGGWIAATAP